MEKALERRKGSRARWKGCDRWWSGQASTYGGTLGDVALGVEDDDEVVVSDGLNRTDADAETEVLAEHPTAMKGGGAQVDERVDDSGLGARRATLAPCLLFRGRDLTASTSASESLRPPNRNYTPASMLGNHRRIRWRGVLVVCRRRRTSIPIPDSDSYPSDDDTTTMMMIRRDDH